MECVMVIGVCEGVRLNLYLLIFEVDSSSGTGWASGRFGATWRVEKLYKWAYETNGGTSLWFLLVLGGAMCKWYGLAMCSSCVSHLKYCFVCCVGQWGYILCQISFMLTCWDGHLSYTFWLLECHVGSITDHFFEKGAETKLVPEGFLGKGIWQKAPWFLEIFLGYIKVASYMRGIVISLRKICSISRSVETPIEQNHYIAWLMEW